MLCGLPGSGKTMTARALAEGLDAIRLCPDEWMAAIGLDLYDQAARARLERLQWSWHSACSSSSRWW